MKFFKLSIVLLVFVIAISIIAPTAFAKKQLNVAVTLGINNTVAQALTKEFELANPDVDVVLDPIPWTSIFEKLLIDFASGTSNYDVVLHSLSTTPTYIKAGYFEPLDKYFQNPDLIDMEKFDLEDIPESLRSEYDGKLYYLPYITFPHILFYRKDVLEKAGLDVPKTMEEYLNTVKAVHNPEKGLYGTCIQGLRGTGAGMGVYNWYPFFFSWGGKVINGNQLGYASSAGIESLKFFKELLNYSPPDAINYGAGQASEAMMGGDVALMIQNADHFARMDDPSRSKVVGKIAYAPLPKGPSGQSIALAGVWNISITKFSHNKELAFRYITYLLSKDSMPIFAKAGGVPPRYSILKSMGEEYPALKLAGEALKTARGVPIVKGYIKIEEVLSVGISLALEGSKTPQQALQDVVKQAQGILQ